MESIVADDDDGIVAQPPSPLIHNGSIQSQLTSLQTENKKLRDEFNTQRAKMKELFLQKESECLKLTKEIDEIKEELSETKSQIVVDQLKQDSQFQEEWKTQEEIASLQKLVQDTIDESSYSKSEIDRLTDELGKLKHENIELRELVHSHQQDSSSLVPVISHVKKTIARKLAGDSSSNDYLEDSMRKVNKYAQEDAEVLRSLVVPLEEEIKALKEKLRTTDEELQKCQQIHAAPSSSGQLTSTIGNNNSNNINKNQLPPAQPSVSSCTLCENNQINLQNAHTRIDALTGINDAAKKDIDRLREQLDKEANVRHDLEEQWQANREAHKKEVEELSGKVTNNEREMAILQLHYNDFKDEINEELRKLIVERENIHRYMEILQSDNEFLAGKYLANSEELQNQRIDLPNTVEELQEQLLKCHEHLIESRVGCEFEQRKSMSYFDEAQVLRDQLNAQTNERHIYQREATIRIKALESQLKLVEVENERLSVRKEAFEKKEMEIQKQASELRLQVIELRESNDKFEKLNKELMVKISALQQELGNSEAVQKDFVRLSQSLQMELEKIRAADTNVRWQDDDDIENCPTCKLAFTVTRRKLHCLHCGTIYCDKCITKFVSSAQRKRPARVCDVCHTLLVRHTAPYFSHAPPQSPT